MTVLLEKLLERIIDSEYVQENISEIKPVMDSLLKELGEKDEAILRYRYLDDEYHSDRDTAYRFGVSEDVIVKMLQEAIEELKGSSRLKELGDLVLVKQNYKVTINNPNGGEDLYWSGFSLFEEVYKKFQEAINMQPTGLLFKSVHVYRDDKLLFSET